MERGTDTISALIDFKADFGKATKSLEEYLSTTTSKVSALESKLSGMLGEKSKVSKSVIQNAKEELDILYKQKAITEQLLVEQRKRDMQATDRVNMLNRNMEMGIKQEESNSKKASAAIKSRMETEAKASIQLNQQVLGWNNLLAQSSVS